MRYVCFGLRLLAIAVCPQGMASAAHTATPGVSYVFTRETPS